MNQQAGSLFDRAPDYSPVYRHLAELREEFHRSGKLDDSNAKLDEIVKLFAAYLAYRSGAIGFFPNLEGDGSRFSLVQLQKAFAATCALPEYQRPDGVSIFGQHPRLVLSQEDLSLAKRLAALAKEAVDEAFRHFAQGKSYDVLNEAFGHFVRDNFRGNVEDAQFLTPSEVVDFIVEVAMEELQSSGRLDSSEPLLLADPCCGVASFLTAFSSHYAVLSRPKPELSVVAQDKVERMVRLATINLSLHKNAQYSATIGNSLYSGSPLDEWNERIDIVLTNPPFGARFNLSDVGRNCGNNAPFFSGAIQFRGPIDSELLFVDRNLRLLRDGGLLAIIVPDSVVSAKGIPALLRHHLKHAVEVRGVVELPSVTFAQAGTRTKTAVLLLRKREPAEKRSVSFMASSKSLGFAVNSRKGVLVKTSEGDNDLPQLLAAYKEYRSGQEASISGSDAALVEQSSLRDVWTPGHYLSGPADSGRFGVALSELVSFVGDDRKRRSRTAGDNFISILHILGDGLIDLQAVRTYSPKTPGVPVQPGEVLLSRINPRIPRVVVVPKVEGAILCSSEFEVMKPHAGIDPYLICFLLLTPGVQSEIVRKTSGTSASHNRIKTRELGSIMLPYAKQDALAGIAKTYQQAISNMYSGMAMVADARLAYTGFAS